MYLNMLKIEASDCSCVCQMETCAGPSYRLKSELKCQTRLYNHNRRTAHMETPSFQTLS